MGSGPNLPPNMSNTITGATLLKPPIKGDMIVDDLNNLTFINSDEALPGNYQQIPIHAYEENEDFLL